MKKLKWRCATVKRILFIYACVIFFHSNTHAFANDSIASIGLGGLELQKTDAVVMKTERLTLSRTQVSVDYIYENITSKPRTETVAFPLPPTEFCGSDFGRSLVDGPILTPGMETWVEGKTVELKTNIIAYLNEKDVSSQLLAMGLLNAPKQKIIDFVLSKSDAEFKKLMLTGLFKSRSWETSPFEYVDPKEAAAEAACFSALWKLKAIYTREQEFPANQKMKVSHRYKPLSGGNSIAMPECFPNAEVFTKYNFDMQKKASHSSDAKVRENFTWPIAQDEVRYELRPGANWAGPIRDFKLTLKSGSASFLYFEGRQFIVFGDFELSK